MESPPRPPVEAVVFDWGGTLSEFAEVDMADLWRMAARHLDPEREDEVCARLVQVEAQCWERVRQDQRSTRLAELLAAASDALALDVAAAVLEEAATHHLDAWTPHIRHDPDAAATLGQLRDRGLRIGLLSNTHWPSAFHEHFLDRDGLGQLIDERCYTSELTHTKPHPTAFRTVLRRLGVAPAATVFVGDRPYDDVFGAQAMGMRAVLRPNPAVGDDFAVTPDATIERLPELLDLVDAWS